MLAALCAAAFLLPGAALGQTTGGASYQPPPAPSEKARVVNGKAIPPENAPRIVKKIIAYANRIVTKPYRYGGGHARVDDTGYDCSGAVSYPLVKTRLLKSPMPSGSFTRWGKAGRGKWVTVYANGGHAYMIVAGLRLDTGYRDRYVRKWGGKPGSGPRWGKPRPSRGFKARHPKGL